MEVIMGETLFSIALFTIIQLLYLKALTSNLLFANQTEKINIFFGLLIMRIL